MYELSHRDRESKNNTTGRGIQTLIVISFTASSTFDLCLYMLRFHHVLARVPVAHILVIFLTWPHSLKHAEVM